MAVRGSWPRLGRPSGTPSGCLYAHWSLQRPTRPCAQFQELPLRLSVSIPGTTALDTASTLAPARCRRSEDLDFGDHSITQFPPELIKQAGAQEPKLGGPCRGITPHVEGGVGKALRC